MSGNLNINIDKHQFSASVDDYTHDAFATRSAFLANNLSQAMLLTVATGNIRQMFLESYRSYRRSTELTSTSKTTKARDRRRARQASAEYVKGWEDTHGEPWSAIKAVAEIMNDFADNVRLEVTAELLSTAFPIGDGHFTTWGDATIDDHQARIATLVSGVTGNLETVALHGQAIEILVDAGASCLAKIKLAA